MNDPSRRSFLRSAPMAAAVGIALADATLFSPAAEGQGVPPAAAAPFQVITSQTFQDDVKALQAKPGNTNLVDAKALPFTAVLTTELTKAGKEFEMHEGRDHWFQILDGSAVYEVGGTLKDARSTKPGEWLAPASEGASSVTVKKGDVLVIPRGCPHKRTTAESVTFLLISPMGTLKA